MAIKNSRTAWVVSVDMGYGHQRAAYALKDIAHGGIITMNNYDGIPASERKVWLQSREGYELVSRLQARSAIGHAVFELFDKFQEIQGFYPKRDLSRPTLQLRHAYHLIEKKGLGKHLFEEVLSRESTLPLLCTFFLAAFAAEHYGYPGDIFCQVCDADVSRTWAPRNPKNSRIKYLAPNSRVVERLKLYGVREENIYAVGFPLPKENIGNPETMHILKKDLGARLVNLDPKKAMSHKFGHIINYHLGRGNISKKPTHPLTLTFAVGGAGAQSSIGEDILHALRHKILTGAIRVILVAGSRGDVRTEYKKIVASLRLDRDKGVEILYEKTKPEYFKSFNHALRTTDILWTKPSELSFYTALGLPLIMAPSLGSQEDFNRVWLKTIGGGIAQNDPRYADEWLFDWIENGWLARAALNGFSGAPIGGVFEIEKLLFEKDYQVREFDEKPFVTV